MTNYLHVPIPAHIKGSLKIIFGDTEYYYKSRLSSEADSDFVATKFGDVTLEGFEDWELVMFGVYWERKGNEVDTSATTTAGGFTNGFCTGIVPHGTD